jgi:hypothetical protein
MIRGKKADLKTKYPTSARIISPAAKNTAKFGFIGTPKE